MTRWVIMLTAMTGQAPRIEAITGMAGLRRRYAPRNDEVGSHHTPHVHIQLKRCTPHNDEVEKPN